MEPTIWQIKKWRKQKETQIKRLKTLLFDREQELENLKRKEAKLEVVEQAYNIINQ